MCIQLITNFHSELPDTIEELTSLSGIGRKTANLILGDVFHKPAVVVDTHCIRITNRLGLADTDDPYKAELQLKMQFCRRRNPVISAIGWSISDGKSARHENRCVISVRCRIFARIIRNGKNQTKRKVDSANGEKNDPGYRPAGFCSLPGRGRLLRPVEKGRDVSCLRFVL